MNNRIKTIVNKLENLMKVEFAKMEEAEGIFISGSDTYHLYHITALNTEGNLSIARCIYNELYMAQFDCAEGSIDIYFGFNAKEYETIRWRYYYENGKYTQGYLPDYFLTEKTSKTILAILSMICEDGHEGHYFHSIHKINKYSEERP